MQIRQVIEPLERRALLALSVQIDYSLDDSGFFASETRRTVLQAAVDEAVSQLGDHLAAITPFDNNSYKATFFDPETGDDKVINNLVVPADTLIIYVGAQITDPDTLAFASPADVSATGNAEWKTLVAGRGQENFRGDSARDFGPVGGAIAFSRNPIDGWYFGTSPAGIGDHVDFYSVALHEMCHILGYGTSDSWEARVSEAGASFAGPASLATDEAPGNVPLSDELGHWESDTQSGGREVAMDPDVSEGTRKNLTPLDLAGLDDIGWEIPIDAALSTGPLFPRAGDTTTTFNVSYDHHTTIAAGAFGGDDLVVLGPNGYVASPTVVSSGVPGASRTVTYSIPAPGGAFDDADTGDYVVTLNAGGVSDAFGNAAPEGAIGVFEIQVNSGPVASLPGSVGNVTDLGGATHEIVVNYSDDAGLDEQTIGVDDITVIRTVGNAVSTPLTVASATIGAPTDGSAGKAVTYVVSAPGGAWDADDNGRYTIALADDQVRDAQGAAAAGGTLGRFDVAVTALTFSAGKPLTFTDADGDRVVISMAGPGSGEAFFSGVGNANVVEVHVSGAAANTALTVNAAGGGTPLATLTVDGPLKSFTGRNTDLTGTMTVTGAVPKVSFFFATGTLTLGGGATSTPVSITIAEAFDLSVNSLSPIKAFKVNNWLDTDSTPDELSAPSIATLAVKGAMGANVRAETIGKMTVGGELTDAEVRVSGSIASIVVGVVARSRIFAGVRDDVIELPDSLDDFSNAAAEIKTFTIKSKTPGSFGNTLVAAAKLGKVALGAFATSAGGSPFGVTAATVKSVTFTADSAKPFRGKALDEPAGSVGVGDFVLRLL